MVDNANIKGRISGVEEQDLIQRDAEQDVRRIGVVKI